MATFLPVLQSFPPSEHQPSRSGNSADSPSVRGWKSGDFFLRHIAGILVHLSTQSYSHLPLTANYQPQCTFQTRSLRPDPGN